MLRMHNAGLPIQGVSPVMASSHTSLKFAEVAANNRGLFGLRGGGGRQDVLRGGGYGIGEGNGRAGICELAHHHCRNHVQRLIPVTASIIQMENRLSSPATLSCLLKAVVSPGGGGMLAIVTN